jgi:hypothetical protein
MEFFKFIDKVLFGKYGKSKYEPQIAKRRRANRLKNKQAALSRRINRLRLA